MSEQTLKFDEVIVSKKEFHASKEAIVLDLVKSSFLKNLNTMKMVLNI